NQGRFSGDRLQITRDSVRRRRGLVERAKVARRRAKGHVHIKSQRAAWGDSGRHGIYFAHCQDWGFLLPIGRLLNQKIPMQKTRFTRAKSIALALGAAAGLFFLAGCNVGITNLTPAVLPENPSQIYTISTRVKPKAVNVVPD